MSFLKAEWRKLVLINYAVDPALLKKYLPYKTELDFWNNTCYVSLVGFLFVNTKMLGLKIPFHVNFEEVNLRFYVKHLDKGEWKRGVIFLKEIVPKAAITIVANTLYGEHYQTMRMKHLWTETEEARTVEYSWRLGKDWQSMRVEAHKNLSPIEEGSEAEFITEHYWGYTKINSQKTFEYGVTHPRWQQYEVNDFDIRVDFGRLYSDEWHILNGLKPTSVMLAEGSEITVENKRQL